MDTKAEIRKRILSQRNAMSDEEVHARSASIYARICSLCQYEQAEMVLAYMDYRNEVMTNEFIKRCMRDAKRVVLPKVEISELNALAVYEIFDLERDTLKGYKGIPEPNSDILNQVAPEKIDFSVIPGVAFDINRNRIGYGAGYYDRFLSKLRQDCLKVGIAYSLQLVDKISAGIYDIPVDLVVTEDRFI